MSESRICPGCEKEVPLDARYYYCPYCFCFFDRKKLNGHNSVGYQGRFREQIFGGLCLRWEYFLSGLVGSGIFVAFLLLFGLFKMRELVQIFWPWLISGGLAGLIGTCIDKKSVDYLSTLKIFLIVVFTAVLGFLSFPFVLVFYSIQFDS